MQFSEEVQPGPDLTLKEVLFNAIEAWRECRRNWKTILLFALPLMGYQLYLRFTTPLDYPATLTFLVNDAKGATIGGLLGQFGGLIGGDKEDKLVRMTELARTRRTVAAALFKKAYIDGRTDFYANHLIRIQDLQKGWEKDTLLAGFKFHRSAVDSFGLRENQVLYLLHQTMVGGESATAMYVPSADKKSGIMSLSLTTRSEALTIGLLKELYASFSDFYIESSVRKEREVLNVLSAKRDSIAGLLFQNDVSTAQHDDQNNNLLLQLDRVPAKRFNRNNTILTAMYGEILKNTELADMALKTATPYITAIDEPIPPLKSVRQGRLKNVAVYFAVGLALGAFFVVFRSSVRAAMAEGNPAKNQAR